MAYAAATAQWCQADKQFIPNPATWFNQGRYSDDQTTWQRIAPTQFFPRSNQPQQSERERLQGILRDNQYPNSDPAAETARRAIVAETTAKLKTIP